MPFFSFAFQFVLQVMKGPQVPTLVFADPPFSDSNDCSMICGCIDVECTMSSMRGEPPIEFDWDTANLRHRAGHKITRLEFERATRNDPLVIDFSDETGEERWCALGGTEELRVLFLVFTFRGVRIRPITGWDASKKLRELYFRKKGE